MDTYTLYVFIYFHTIADKATIFGAYSGIDEMEKNVCPVCFTVLQNGNCLKASQHARKYNK